MNRTTAQGSVDGAYVDDDSVNEIQGTLLVAADRNAIQEELLAIIEGAGLTPSAANLAQVWGALIKGVGSQINADKLDGQEGAFYQNAGNLNAGTIPSSRYAAADLLAKLLTVDGVGSSLDSDKLDGQEGSYYQNAGNLNAGTIPSARLSASALLTLLLTVDGSGSALDADLLDGAHKDTDGTLGGNSDSSIPTEKAVKTYVATRETVIKNVCWPVGATYIQFPGDSSPSTLGLPGTWTNVSSEVAGDFIRFEGGNASSFNSGEQSDAMQRITGTITGLITYNSNSVSGVFSNGTQVDVQDADGGSQYYVRPVNFNSAGSSSPNAAKTNDAETRPVNRTVRKWRRTA